MQKPYYTQVQTDLKNKEIKDAIKQTDILDINSKELPSNKAVYDFATHTSPHPSPNHKHAVRTPYHTH